MIINSNTAAANLLPSALTARSKSPAQTRAAAAGADQAQPDAVSTKNLTAASAPIMDEDAASETTESMRQMIIAQNSMAMMAQANSLPLRALRLLQQ
jgi:flagellin-like hook-associated protein FlgL